MRCAVQRHFDENACVLTDAWQTSQLDQANDCAGRVARDSWRVLNGAALRLLVRTRGMVKPNTSTGAAAQSVVGARGVPGRQNG